MREQLVPELRFPEFEGEWEEKKGKFIFKTISIKNKGYLDVLSATQDRGVVYRKDLDMEIQYDKANLNNYKKVSKTDFVISLRSFQGGIECSDIEGIMSPAYTIFNFKDKELYSTDFFRVMFKSGDFIRKLDTLTYGVRDGKSISYRDFSNINFKIPSPQEQQKIGDFFYKIDKKLELQQEKIDNLKKYKKGIMQRIFSQEIRFKDDNGNDYPDWEEKKLGEIVKFIKNYSYSRNDEGEGKYSHIHYGDIHSRYNGLITKNTVVPKIKSNKEHIELKDGDIIVADASEDYKDLGKTVILLEKGSRNIIASLHTFALRPNEKLNSIYFLNYSYSDSYKQYMYKKGTGISVFGINKKNLENMSILLPSLQEQVKIANFLSSIDRKIELEEEKLEEYKKLKKGLMQRMFI